MRLETPRKVPDDPNQHDQSCPKFQLIYVINDDDHNVEVVETSKINVVEMLARLEAGDSVFITCQS